MKKIIISLIVILIVGIGVYYYINNDTKKAIEKEDNIDYLNVINDKNIDDIEYDFLKYVDDNYESALKDLNDLLSDQEYNENMWYQITGFSYKVLKDLENNINLNIVEDQDNTITFVGDTSLADNYLVMQAYKERNIGLDGILSPEVQDYINNSSVLILNSEFAFGTSGDPMAGKIYTFIGDPSNVNMYHEMGVDLVTLANNHVYDYGTLAFNETLDTFKNANIPYIGAGSNIEEAAEAYYFVVNGYKISFINANRSEKYILTPGASENSEGVFRCYDPENLIQRIKEEKEISDIVIPILHWGLEASHTIEEVLLETGKMYIDAGADAIVGHHAHVLQGIEFYNDKPIVYNIGNFIFDDYSRELGIVTFEVNDDMSMNYTFLPALQENIYTDFLYGEEKEVWINNLNDWSINTTMDIDGSFYPTN